MKKRIILTALTIGLLGVGLAAQAAPDAEVLTQMLNEFLAGASRNDAAVHDRFWADDLIYTGSSGRRVGKADIMKDVRSAPPAKPEDEKVVYSARDVRIQQYGDTAVVAFRLIALSEKDGKAEEKQYLNSGTFVKRDGQWRAVCWQATAAAGPR